MKHPVAKPGEPPDKTSYLSTLGAWALAFGCAVGWGAYVMPGTTFLPIAGPLGTAMGIGIGALVMLVLGANYHYLMNRFSDSGGTYTYTKNCFGYDHGFLSAWFLILTYIAIIWANATALPLIARTLLGSVFQFGYLYEIAGYKIYAGEILLAVAALVIAALICMRRKGAEKTQIVMAIALFAGIVICFAVAFLRRSGGAEIFEPAYSPKNSGLGGTFTIFALAPWAFVGFESISHSNAEISFSKKRVFPILAVAIVTAAAAYILLSLLAVTALPEGCGNWMDYILNLDSYSGLSAQPTFFAAHTAMGAAGSALLGVAVLCAIFTGLIGNYIALSRLICSLSKDDMLPEWAGKLDENQAPRRAILCILAVSAVLPFFGRTAISWIVDVTTVGATIAYTFTSACASRTARKEKNKAYIVTGMVGMVVSLLFALEFLIPNITSVKTLATESYLILAAWGILGFLYFRVLLRKDKERRLGRSIVAWVVLLALIIFTSTVWMRQATEASIENSVVTVQSYYSERLSEVGVDVTATATRPTVAYLQDELDKASNTLGTSSLIQIGLIVVSLIVLLEIYTVMQKREKQIEVEKTLAEESSRAKTSFLSNMSHEIRTPMNAIIGLDNIALREPTLPPQTREQLEKIGASAKHLLGLINDILDMSRIESGRMVLKNEEFSFREFLDQINIIINGQCQDKGLHYECNLVGGVSDYYFGDDMKLKQVLINILGNSVKFTNAPGSVTLTAEQTASFEGFCTLRFTMADTGIGMDKEYIPKIFEAFTQEDNSRSSKYGSTGLGMAITKRIVEMMNGTIDVESEKGVGSVFTVVVTLKNCERRGASLESTIDKTRMRVLVVDDEKLAVDHARTILDEAGIRVDTCTSGQEALTMLDVQHTKQEPYNLVLMDWDMPGMNGIEATRRIREHYGNESAVIILTAYNWDDIMEEATRSGVDGFLAKPLFASNVISEFERVARRNNLSLFKEKQRAELAGRRILLAEDMEINAEIMMDVLDMEDIQSEHAENGRIAVEMFEKSAPGYYDAILMDVRMPEMDGLEAASAIRAMDRADAKRIPIIALTANAFDEDVQRSLQAGMNAHLTKPIEPENLYQALGELIYKAENAE